VNPIILLIVIILAPLSAALVIVLLRRVPELLALSGIGIALIASIKLFFIVSSGVNVDLVLPGLPNMPLLLSSTALTALLSTMVSVIAAMVLIYAVGYMKHDTEKPRFFATMLLFINRVLVSKTGRQTSSDSGFFGHA